MCALDNKNKTGDGRSTAIGDTVDTALEISKPYAGKGRHNKTRNTIRQNIQFCRKEYLLVRISARYIRWSFVTILRYRAVRAGIFSIGIVFCPSVVEAQQQLVAEEERIEAATILQFIPFIEWPANVLPDNTNNEAPIIIGIVGTSRVEEFLSAQARNKRLPDGRQILVKRLSTLEEMDKCHLIYICYSESGRLSQIMSKLKNKPIVSIGHDERFMDKGGLINMYTDNDRMRFEINSDEAANCKIRFSAKLLRLGRIYSKR